MTTQKIDIHVKVYAMITYVCTYGICMGDDVEITVNCSPDYK